MDVANYAMLAALIAVLVLIFWLVLSRRKQL